MLFTHFFFIWVAFMNVISHLRAFDSFLVFALFIFMTRYILYIFFFWYLMASYIYALFRNFVIPNPTRLYYFYVRTYTIFSGIQFNWVVCSIVYEVGLDIVPPLICSILLPYLSKWSLSNVCSDTSSRILFENSSTAWFVSIVSSNLIYFIFYRKNSYFSSISLFL